MATITQTATSTYARHIASKIAADLQRLQRLYKINRPTNEEILNYLEESALLLKYGCLETVIYGFKRNDKWVIALKYQAIGNQLVGTGDDPGGIYQPANLSETNFMSFLTYSRQPTNDQRREIEECSQIKRVGGHASEVENGYWTDDKRYLSGEIGVQRSMIRRNR